MSSSLTSMGGCLCIEGGLLAWGAIQLTFWYWPEKNVKCQMSPAAHSFLLWTWILPQLDNIYSCSNYTRPCMWWMICIEIGQKLNKGDKLASIHAFHNNKPSFGTFWTLSSHPVLNLQAWHLHVGPSVILNFMTSNIRRWNFSTPEGKVSKGAAQAQTHDIKYFLLL